MQKQPDPIDIEQISLTDAKDGPKLRLYRNQRYQQMAIQFDEKPDPQHAQKLRDAGFRWRAEDKVWTKQIDREKKWQTRADAEKLFRQIGNGIREERGLEPSQAVSF